MLLYGKNRGRTLAHKVIFSNIYNIWGGVAWVFMLSIPLSPTAYTIHTEHNVINIVRKKRLVFGLVAQRERESEGERKREREREREEWKEKERVE